MSAGGVAGNGGSPAGRINAALEKAPHLREAEINSSRGYLSRKYGICNSCTFKYSPTPSRISFTELSCSLKVNFARYRGLVLPLYYTACITTTQIVRAHGRRS